MGMLIAVTGSPGSGKTVLATRLGMKIYDMTKEDVICMYPDPETPVMARLFPFMPQERTGSLGVPLTAAGVSTDAVLREITTRKSRPGLGFLGFRRGENGTTYPRYGEKRCREFLDILSDSCSYVIADCSSWPGDVLSETALSRAGVVIHTVNPTLKSLAWYASHRSNAVSGNSMELFVMNTTDGDIIYPIDEIREEMPECAVTVPFSLPLKTAEAEGKIWKDTGDRAFDAAVHKMAVLSAGLEGS